MCNVGKLDRIVRALFAILMIGVALYFVPTMIPKTLLLIASVLLLMSAWFGVCYMYRIFHFSTAKPEPVPHR